MIDYDWTERYSWVNRKHRWNEMKVVDGKTYVRYNSTKDQYDGVDVKAASIFWSCVILSVIGFWTTIFVWYF